MSACINVHYYRNAIFTFYRDEPLQEYEQKLYVEVVYQFMFSRRETETAEAMCEKVSTFQILS